MRILLLALSLSAWIQAQALDEAYAALREKSYEQAIHLFWKAAAAQPDSPAIRKDLAYTYLKIGDTVAARDQFAEAMRLNPSDLHVALEYAFLCHETKQTAIALRIFDQVRRTGNATAEQAFQNIDRPLRESIARWQKALIESPANFSAHQELAQLAEQAGELDLAGEHYEAAWRLKPQLRELLVDLGRVRKAQNRAGDAMTALLAASRGRNPRVAEQAKELMPARYPYVYEFRTALDLDPANVDLRRELAYLHLAMNNKDAAEAEFVQVLANAPDDSLSMAQLGFLRLSRNDVETAAALLEKAMKSGDKQLTEKIREALKVPRLGDRSSTSKPVDARTLADRSLQAGYLKDAIKYLKIAHEADPVDYSVMLKLGWTHNILRQDKYAVHWFRLAQESPDPKIAGEAKRAYRNLRGSVAPVRTTAWMFPSYSTRWKDTFAYGQIKTEFRLGNLPVRTYLSTRLIGDTKGLSREAGMAGPLLSESSLIFGVGLATNNWKGAMAWAEAGSAVRYVQRNDVGRMIPDYRGGVSYGRSIGRNFGSESSGAFYETNADAVYISRFDDDTLFYSQNRAGYTTPTTGPLQTQLLWNFNATTDTKRQYWANFAEQGPGLRFRVFGSGLILSVSALKGRYLVLKDNPRGRSFNDLRIGLWYAFTH